ncbi:Methyl sulfide methyltransferase-associated sensor [uncultured archaeon]|nr:Methyl sulfide methyltransferase-associated sensor [uncultured archaeon]
MKSLRFKIIVSTLMIGLLIIIGSYIVIQDIQKGIIEGEFRDKGFLVSNHLRLELTTPLLTNDLKEIKDYIDNLKNSYTDIEYIFVTDPEGIVLVHTFEDGFPVALQNLSKPSNVRKEFIYNSERGVIHEFDAPLLNDIGYVHVGLSETRVRMQIQESSDRLLLLSISAFILWGVFIFFTGRWLTEPVLRLTEGAKRINKGILDQKIEVTSGDELGELAATFNDMSETLDQKIKDLLTSKEQTETTQKYLETLFDSIDDGITVVNTGHEIIKVNESLLKMIQQNEEQLLGKSCPEMIFGVHHPQDMEGCPVSIMLRTRKPMRLLREVQVNGSTKIMEINGTLFSDSRGETNVILVLRDVTQQKALEAEIIARNRELTTLNEISKNISESFELDKILAKALENLLKLTRMEHGEAYLQDEKSGDFALAVGAGKDATYPLPKVLPPYINTTGVLTIDDPRKNPWIVTPAGSDIDTSFIGIPLKLKDKVFGVITLQGCSQHKFSMKDRELFSAIGNQLGVAIENITFYNNIKHLKEFNEEILNNVNLAIHVVDQDMNILAVNDELIKLSRDRFKKEEMINRNLFELYPFLKETNAEKEYEYVQKTGEIFQSEERTEYLGDVIYTSTSKIPVRDHTGSVVKIITVMKDVTEQRRLEDELKDSYEELRLTYLKLKELFKVKENFLSNMSHELRTPLTAIMGYSELMLDEKITPEQKHKLEVIYRNSQRLSRLIQGLLTIAVIESKNLALNIQTLPLYEMILQASEEMKMMSEIKKIHINIDISEQLTVEGDRDKLMQVFSNILDNAVKFTLKGKINITATAENEGIHIKFEDTGIGIPQDKLDKIFDRFYQLDSAESSKRGGAGLGLWIAKNIVEAHGGKIWAESKNRGSTFHVLLIKRR